MRRKLWIKLLKTARKSWIGPHIALTQTLLRIYGPLLKNDCAKRLFLWENSEEKILEIWNIIDQKTVAKLYEPMESKIEKVSRVKGAPIGY